MQNNAAVSLLVVSTPSQYDHGVTPSAQDYDPHAFPPFAVATDIVVFTIRAQRLQVVLVQRNEDPYRLAWALPGGFVRPDEDLEQVSAADGTSADDMSSAVGGDTSEEASETASEYGGDDYSEVVIEEGSDADEVEHMDAEFEGEDAQGAVGETFGGDADDSEDEMVAELSGFYENA